MPPDQELILSLTMIFEIDERLITYNIVVNFEATDFASNFLHQVLDLRQRGQVSSDTQVRLLLQHDSKELRDRGMGSGAGKPLFKSEAGRTSDFYKNKSIVFFRQVGHLKDLQVKLNL